ncbi:gluconokinase [Ornithinimicrobium cryptoxanthini]|uniref:gluconokinase n=1 Tax=Ornithinimicrobium cryptoxanthini TaxID=2934161 RepID=UPI00211792DC|nr:FGGY family carbohydrate kinase [Ornithinimicrobium cryptoxanthini]
MASEFEIDWQDAVPPLVLALDVGSTASRGMVFDAHGRPVGRRAKVAHGFTVAPDGTSELDPDQVVEELREIIDTLTTALDGRPVAGVALDTFASSLVAVDRQGAALTPCYTYADSRCGHHVDSLREEVSEEEIQQRTGTRVHSSYWPARLRWLAAERPEVVDAAALYLSLGDYVLRSLTGAVATGTSSAAWTGMVDRHTADWSPEVVALAGIRLDQLPPVHHLDQPLEISAERAGELARTWPELAEARWFAAVADGFAANVGLGAHDETTIGASCATSGALRVLIRDLPDELPAGLWCYRVSHDRALLGGALNDVGRALAWADAALATGGATGGATGAASQPAYDVATDALTDALMSEPQESTPLVLPFFTGERSTGWASHARAVVTGLGEGSSPVEVYRGVAEGIALAYARIESELRVAAPQSQQLVCGGRVSTDRPELLQMMADAMQAPVTPVTIKRSTLRGCALLALETLAPGVERARPPHGETLTPDPQRQRHYADRLDRFERVYEALFRS